MTREKPGYLTLSVLLLALAAAAWAQFQPGAPNIRFAVIGDFGQAGQPELDVANLVKSWNPDFVITTGDNNYPAGEASTIDANIGQYYREFIHPYRGRYGAGASSNRFFPSLGNHDQWTDLGQAYYDYFTLPGNERYYEFTWGPVHFFALNGYWREPDGITSTSVQGQWLKARMAASTSRWKVVYFHESPFSSGSEGGTVALNWPFHQWGADAVITGHNHDYERIEANGIPYFVNGLGGSSLIAFPANVQPTPGTAVRFDRDFGAMQVTAGESNMTFRFVTRRGVVVDDYTLLPRTGPPMNNPAVGSVLSAASFDGNWYAPGGLVSIFGDVMGPETGVSVAVGAPAPVRVLFDGIPGATLYASRTQINAALPFAVEGRQRVSMQVEYRGLISAPREIWLAPAVPAIFALSARGRGPAAALNQDFTVNSAMNRAGEGSVLMLYVTGLGQTSPPSIEGTVNAGLTGLVQPVRVQIGGVAAEVLYAGAAPGLIAGVYQVNVRVPAGAAPGAAVPLVIFSGTRSSQTGLTVAVR